MRSTVNARAAALALLAAVVALAGCGHVIIRDPYDDREVPGARVVVREGLAVAEVGGTPEEIGAQVGALFREEIAGLLEECFDAWSMDAGRRARALATARRIPEPYRREIAACARAAGVAEDDLLAANAMVDSFCSAIAASGAARGGAPLAVARDMDFHPARVIGPYTVVTVVRPAGKRPFATVGWPGVAGVVSGMNDAGVTAAVLVRLGGSGLAGGEPILFRVRELLEGAATREAALDAFEASPVASGHFVLVADERGASTTHALGELDRLGGDARRTARAEMREGVLVCTNDAPDRLTAMPCDARGRCLDDLARTRRGPLDDATLREMIAATYLDKINAQAMLLHPASRTIEVARGTSLRPASLQEYVALPLAACLRGGSVAAIEARRSGEAEGRLARYDAGAYPAREADAGIAAAYRKASGEAAALRDPAARARARIDVLGGLTMALIDVRPADRPATESWRALAEAWRASLEDLERWTVAMRAAPSPDERRSLALPVESLSRRLVGGWVNPAPELTARAAAIHDEAEAAFR